MNTKLKQTLAGIALLSSIQVAMAEEFLSRAITIISPGGSADLQARILAEHMQNELGQPVNVVSKAGGAGSVGMNATRNARNDGYTIGFTAIGPTVVTPNKANVGYTYNDFTPVALVSSVPYSISVAADSNIKTLSDLVKVSKEKGSLTYGTTGTGLHLHLIMSKLFSDIGAEMVHIPSKGAAGTKSALLGGHIDVATLSLPDAIPLAQSGDFHILNTTGADRASKAPDVHSLIEDGYNMEALAWFGMIAPKGLDPKVLSVLESSVKNALEDPEVRAKL
ncbi:tripartite tricarboxylate transporter substrate binding protein [Vibrio diabolicus]|uniref:Tripartite tricarboxylate transporter substrate binding protein n=1 Tax=Vibrio diabolicus TaxID=50719 RepID=A0AA92LQH8_9VIBR|nr:tripartite tricarboxylate transporter substrate binding protein [Vibrio diabolicus]QRG81514.1 tripartite tricarboxylate transporter substrate binding protein [Vibrio diabolicus]